MDSDDDDFYYFSRHDYMYDTDDSGPNYDDDYYDDYEEYYDSDAEARIIRKMAKLKAQKESNVVFVPDIHQCKSLVDICSKHLALNFPFAYLQDRFPPVPDDLQLRVISFSFPDNEEKIRKYAEFSRSDADIMYPSRLCDTGKVTEMMQIGFRLSANADGKYVTIHFDRGLDEECHWFVCSKGFKENCTNLIYEALDTLGFASLEYREENYHLHELWYKNRCQQPLVKDDIDMEIGSEFHSAYLLERRHDSSKILETVLDLLKDDTMSGFVAIKSCTEQLLSRFEKNKLHRSNYSRNSHTQVTNRPFYPSGSPAMGFTSRPFRSWMLCDELSRLWQVAVLNPKLKLKEQEQVVQELFKWNNEGKGPQI
ncbi:hypothetical protein QZH41_012329 [Actinostola sp. cb2023]|nr:hypothetical protein QZH41_012329 [Actinostola sp. cb2023]